MPAGLSISTVRRWILKDGSLDEKIAVIMNSDPFYLSEGYLLEDAREMITSQAIEGIPIVDDSRKVVSSVWWTDLFDGKAKECPSLNVPIVIMAGGEGQRLAPYNTILPKPLMPIGDKTMIELIIDKFIRYDCKDIYLSVNYKSNLIKAYFNDLDIDFDLKYIQEKSPLGTAGSLHLLKRKIKTTFFLSNCDILVEADYADILEFHRKNKNKITIVCSMKHYAIPYGICEIENGGDLKRIKEKPEYDFLVNTGFYLLEPEVLKDIPKNSVFHITDLINCYLGKGKKLGVYPISEKSWSDLGQLEQLYEMLDKFRDKK